MDWAYSIAISDRLAPPQTCSFCAGCSRPRFNGDYVQQPGQFYYRRPVFHCYSNKMYLFYHGKRLRIR